MAEGSGAKDAPHPFTDEARALGIDVDDPRALAWMEEHLPEFRQQAAGQRPLYWILGIGFVVGLAAHVGGFLLRSSVTTELFELMADLLYSLGFALWTGVVVVVFVQVFPEANGGSSSRRWMPTRQRWARRPEPEATRRQGMTQRRRRGSGGSPRVELAGTGQRAVRAEGASGSVRKGPARSRGHYLAGLVSSGPPSRRAANRRILKRRLWIGARPSVSRERDVQDRSLIRWPIPSLATVSRRCSKAALDMSPLDRR